MVTEDSDDILRDIRRWVKIIGLQEAKPVLLDALSDEDEERERDLRITYHLTDGEHGRRDIALHISYSRQWIGDRHSEWANLGLIERDSPNSSYRHVISLKEAGIEVPDIPDPDEKEEDEDEEEEEASDESEEGEPTETAEEAELTDYE